MKSNLQTRAERSAKLFAERARKPLVIEFAGVPKAGKTSYALARTDISQTLWVPDRRGG